MLSRWQREHSWFFRFIFWRKVSTPRQDGLEPIMGRISSERILLSFKPAEGTRILHLVAFYLSAY